MEAITIQTALKAMGNSNNKEKKSSLELSPEATTTSDLRYDSEINQ